MTDKVQKIRNYACELLKDSQNGFGSASYNMLKMVIAYIDSLPEEPVNDELKVELEKYIKDHFTIDTEQLDRFGIEEKDYMYSMDESDMLALVEHFTNWQKTKEVEEAAREFIEPYREVSECGLDYNIHPAKAFKAGANWQKEQMMANAIDVEVKLDAGGYPYIDRTIELYDYDKDIPLAKEGDRYKVILIKE